MRLVKKSQVNKGQSEIGNLQLLNTTTKATLVDAINELQAGSGGGIPGGLNKQIQFNDGGAFAGNSALQFNKSTNSTYLGNPSAFVAATGNITFYGTSITLGGGTTGSGVRYSTLVANALGLTEINLGVSGSSVENRSPANLPAGINFISRDNTITTYIAGTTQWFIIEPGPNDFIANSANYNATNYTTDLTTFVNAVIAAGWPLSKIKILGNSYLNPSSYNSTYLQFIAATQTVASNFGIGYIDLYAWFNTRGGVSNLFDALHPNNDGHILQANAVLSLLSTNRVYLNSQLLGVNGLGEFSNLKLNNTTFLPDTGNILLGADSSGNIGNLRTLPTGTRTGASLYISGQINSYTTVVGTGYTLGVQDWVFPQNTIYSQSAATPGNFTSTKLIDASAGYTFQTSLDVGTLSLAQFINGAGVTAMKLLQNGSLYLQGSVTVPFGAFGYASDISLPWGIFEPFASSNFGTNIKNTYHAGFVAFFVSDGITNGTIGEAARITTNKALLINTTSDDGINKLQVNGGAKFTSPIIVSSGYTVAGLPAGTIGMRAYVTDATAPTYNGILTGGGAIKVSVFYNGTAWVSA